MDVLYDNNYAEAVLYFITQPNVQVPIPRHIKDGGVQEERLTPPSTGCNVLSLFYGWRRCVGVGSTAIKCLRRQRISQSQRLLN